MRYPVLIEPRTPTTSYGVEVPDLPGRFSAGDTLDEALSNAEEAAALWIDTALDEGMTIPAPSDLETITRDGWFVGVITVDPSLLDDTVERTNITLPRRVLSRLDAQARSAGESRSGYIARLTLGPTQAAVSR